MKTLGGAENKKASKADAKTEEKPAEKIDFSKVKVEPLFEEFVDFETFSKSDFRAVKVKACEAVPKSKKLLKFVLDDGSGEDRVILSGIHEYYEPEELVGKTSIAMTKGQRRLLAVQRTKKRPRLMQKPKKNQRKKLISPR